jgi:hypothetical protein
MPLKILIMDSVKNCRTLYKTVLISVEYCLIMLKFVQNGWCAGLSRKISIFAHKMLLSVISFPIVKAK